MKVLRSVSRSGGLLVVILISLGCADFKRRESNGLLEQGRYVESVRVLEQASNRDPDNTLLRSGYLARKAEAASRLLNVANGFRAQGKIEEARAIAMQVFEFDSNHDRAKAFLADLDRDIRHADWMEQAQGLAKKKQWTQALLLLDKILSENAKHRDALALRARVETLQRQQQEEQTLRLQESRPVSLEF